MTPWQKRTTTLTQRMAEDMLLRNMSQATIDAYTYHVGRFAEFPGRSPESASPEDVRSFQLHLIQERKVGWSSFNQAVCGLRFLYRHTFPRPWVVKMVPFGKRPKRLPTVLSGDDVSRLISCVSNLKHRTFLLTLYSAGLRLNEAARVRDRVSATVFACRWCSSIDPFLPTPFAIFCSAVADDVCGGVVQAIFIRRTVPVLASSVKYGERCQSG